MVILSVNIFFIKVLTLTTIDDPNLTELIDFNYYKTIRNATNSKYENIYSTNFKRIQKFKNKFSKMNEIIAAYQILYKMIYHFLPTD